MSRIHARLIFESSPVFLRLKKHHPLLICPSGSLSNPQIGGFHFDSDSDPDGDGGCCPVRDSLVPWCLGG
jgi:hypothetical protein